MLTMSPRRFGVVMLLVALVGCAGPVNPRLAAYDTSGYRYVNVRAEGPDEELFVILAFSGGGTRAAAFSYGVLEGLRTVTYRPATGPERTLLDEVDVISSVSGGSFTAAHYALFGTEGFKHFEDNFLYRNIEGALVARALAASSAFPILLSPLTLHNYSGGRCDEFRPPLWLTNGLASAAQPRRVTLARALMSYRTDVKDRPFVHLLDGGLSDNIGLRGPYVALSGQDSAWSLFTKINQGKVRRVLVITANARTGRDPGWDKRESPPGIVDVLGLVTTGPMGNYSFETVQLIAEHFTSLKLDLEDYRACEKLAKTQCPAFSMPFDPPAEVSFHTVELAFENLTDDVALTKCLEGLATSFHLPRAQVTLLRLVAQRLLMSSSDFRAAMAAIAPGWQPREVTIDPALIAEACKKS